MMAPEEIGERRPVNHTPSIALAIAALLLLVVGALSYRDFVRSSLEKEYAEKERQLMMRHGYPVQAYQGQPVIGNQAQLNQAQLNQAQLNQAQLNQQVGIQASAQQGVQGTQGQLPAGQAVNPNMVQQAANMGIESSLPRPVDPEIDAIRNSLAQVREQSMRTDQQYKDLSGEVDSRVKEATSEPITAALPDFLREAVANPPGGNPSVEAELAQMREKVMAAPALARVTGYDKEWGILTFDAGAGQGVKKDQRFAVRRGSEILGWVKVDEVQANQSIAVLVTKNRDSDTAVKPSVGDDLINFELF